MTRIEQEKTVVRQMIAIYCRRHHDPEGNGLCEECGALLSYACLRLDKCPKGNSKSSCRKCGIHCYSPANREKIRKVMRYVGPRMIFINPWRAVRHMITEFK